MTSDIRNMIEFEALLTRYGTNDQRDMHNRESFEASTQDSECLAVGDKARSPGVPGQARSSSKPHLGLDRMTAAVELFGLP
jgi:hypothetical protein